MGGQRLPGADGIGRVQFWRDSVDFDPDLRARVVQKRALGEVQGVGRDADAVRVQVVARDLVGEPLIEGRPFGWEVVLDPGREVGQANVLPDLDAEPRIAPYSGGLLESDTHDDPVAGGVAGRGPGRRIDPGLRPQDRSPGRRFRRGRRGWGGCRCGRGRHRRAVRTLAAARKEAQRQAEGERSDPVRQRAVGRAALFPPGCWRRHEHDGDCHLMPYRIWQFRRNSGW